MDENSSMKPSFGIHLRQLIRSIAIGHWNDDESQERENDLFDLSMRLLSSRLLPSTEVSNVRIKKLAAKCIAIRQTATATATNGENAAKTIDNVERCLERLSRTRTLKQKNSALYFICELSEARLHGEAEYFQVEFEKAKHGEDSHHAHAQYEKNLTLTNALIPHLKSKDQSAISSEKVMYSSAISSSYTTQQLVPEWKLVRDLLFLLQGIDGTYIRFEEDTNSIQIVDNVQVEQASRQLIARIAELGWLFKRIQQRIDTVINRKNVGLVEQSFAGALQFELVEHYRFISSLESQLNMVLKNGSPSNSFTLKRLYVFVQEPIRQMHTLALLVDSGFRMRGGALVSTVASHSYHGDSLIVSIVQRLLKGIAQPILLWIQRWISLGVLVDPHCEFFVSVDDTVENDRMWSHKYDLRMSMLPSFISADSAHQILLIGKNINFIRLWKRSWTLPIVDLHDRDGIENPELLKNIVEQLADVTNVQLMNLVNVDFSFLRHASAIKSYLLLSQGDFSQQLLDTIGKELDRPALELYQHNLLNIVDSAVRSSTEDPLVMQHLGVKLLHAKPGETGWDVFTLQYTVGDSPLRVIFSQAAMERYMRVFQFLFQLKRAEHELNHVFRIQHAQASKLETIDIRGLPILFRRSHHLRQEMTHFVVNLTSYIMFEVLECAWKELLTRVASSKTFDDMLLAHRLYVREVETKVLFGGEHLPLLELPRNIFQAISVFKGLQSRIYDDAHTELLRCVALKEQASLTTSGRSGWAITAAQQGFGSSSALVAVFDRNAQELSDLEDRFHTQLHTFLNHLYTSQQSNMQDLLKRLDLDQTADDSDTASGALNEADHRQFDRVGGEIKAVSNIDGKQDQLHNQYSQRCSIEELEFLRFRLDFNEYYGTQQKILRQPHHAPIYPQHVIDKNPNDSSNTVPIGHPNLVNQPAARISSNKAASSLAALRATLANTGKSSTRFYARV